MAADALVLELRRVLPAPPEVVWAALTEPAELARWWGPEGFEVPEVTFTPVAGQPYRIAMRPPGGEVFHLGGRIVEARPPVYLSYSFEWDPPDADDVETVVRLTLDALAGRTELGLDQGTFRTPARLALHRAGWSESLDKLRRLLSAGGR
jgi:uncharacterized protein YndB with AHSA1/START domain